MNYLSLAKGFKEEVSDLLRTEDLEGVFKSQNLKVSSPAPVTIVSPSGLIERYRTLIV